MWRSVFAARGRGNQEGRHPEVDGIYQATGIANTHMIVTSDGNVLFDTGIGIQAAKQLRLLQEKSSAPVSHIILSHSHADHIGGTQFWQEGDTEIVAHREFVGEQRYLDSLDKLIALDATIKGMNEGKTVHQLMAEIKLPPELALTEEHGKVSWGVKTIWEYYMGWFHFESTTELYAVPAREIYGELAVMVGNENLLASALNHMQQSQPEKALHFLEIILAEPPDYRAALETRLSLLQYMLERAVADNGGNNYEKDYLRRRIAITAEALAEG